MPLDAQAHDFFDHLMLTHDGLGECVSVGINFDVSVGVNVSVDGVSSTFQSSCF